MDVTLCAADLVERKIFLLVGRRPVGVGFVCVDETPEPAQVHANTGVAVDLVLPDQLLDLYVEIFDYLKINRQVT